MKKLFLFFAFALLLLGGKMQAQTDGTLDTSFNIGEGFNSYVRCIVLQPDGKILVVGSFTTYKGLTQNRIARLNTDGSLDTSFDIGEGFNNYVNTIALQPDGKILVGGGFTTYKGMVRNYIARLNTDGSIDTFFDIGIGLNGSVNSIALQPDGKILVGGGFMSYESLGLDRNRIARLNTDGSFDASFETGEGFNNTVASIALQPDGKILVGGIFSHYKGINRNNIVRLNADGNIDTSFNMGMGFNYNVDTITLQPDRKILVGGEFAFYNEFGPFNLSIVRLNTDGTLDSSFNITTELDSRVYSIILQPDGKILLGGIFYYRPYFKPCIARLNTDGTLDTSFETGEGFDSTVRSIVLQADGKILAGGNFTTYKGLTQNRIARLHNTILSTTDINKKELALFPNPVKDLLNFSEEVSNIKITDIAGRTVKEISAKGKSVNVANLAKGVYVITAVAKSGEAVTKKIIKQ